MMIKRKNIFILMGLLGSLIIFITMIALTKGNNALLYCKASQLKIYELAVDNPGMMHDNSLYGVINTSKTKCQLFSKVKVTPIKIDGNKASITCADTSSQNFSVVVDPVGNKDYISNKQLVWFALYNNNACDSKFDVKEIQVQLVGIDKRFTVAYSAGGNCLDDRHWCSRLKKKFMNWNVIKSDNCTYDPFEAASQKFIKDTVYFKKLARCG